MGRIRKPTLLKVLQNSANPSRDRAAAFEPIPRAELGDPPAEWLVGSTELKEWEYALRNCPVGMLRSTDRRALIAWCEACATYDRLGAIIRKEGSIIKTPNGMLASSPYVTQQEKAFTRIRRLAAELGFTPTARAKVQVRESERDTGSDWARLKAKTETASGGDRPAAEAPTG